VVAVDKGGKPSFQELQKVLEARRQTPLQYLVFDLPFFDGHDLRQCSLVERKEILRQALIAAAATGGEFPVVRYGDQIRGDGTQVFEQVRKLGLEGIVSKLASGTYASARTRSWLKIKSVLR